jgi:hypothetical protein
MRLTSHVSKVLRQAPKPSRFSLPRTGYVILSGSFVSNSAGIYCLHRLCHELNRLGYPSFTTGGHVGAEHLNAPMVDSATATDLCARGFTAIYPETILGNPLNAGNVVRWVLNRPALLGGDESYADSELVFSYSDVFSSYIKNSIAGKLYMPTIDTSLFYCDDSDVSKRSLECFYVGKSKWKDGLVDPTRAYEITREKPAKKDLGKIFRASKVLYCFDNSTILIYEALMCGCPVVVIPDGTQTKEDFAQLELGMDGIAWGPEELKTLPVDVAGLQAKYKYAEQQFVLQLKQMISISQAQASEAIDWNSFRWKSHSTTAAAILANLQKVRDFTREIERAIRRFRKAQLQRLRKKNVPDWASNDVSFYCTNWDLENRTLECYCSDGTQGRSRAHIPADALEVTATMSGSEIGKLFRASRQFYTFDEHHPLVNHALACGCRVALADKCGNLRYLTASNNRADIRQPTLQPNSRKTRLGSCKTARLQEIRLPGSIGATLTSDSHLKAS